MQKKCEVTYYPYCFQTLACIYYLRLCKTFYKYCLVPQSFIKRYYFILQGRETQYNVFILRKRLKKGGKKPNQNLIDQMRKEDNLLVITVLQMNWKRMKNRPAVISSIETITEMGERLLFHLKKNNTGN